MDNLLNSVLFFLLLSDERRVWAAELKTSGSAVTPLRLNFLSDWFVSSEFISSRCDTPGGVLDLRNIGSGYGSSLSCLETDFFRVALGFTLDGSHSAFPKHSRNCWSNTACFKIYTKTPSANPSAWQPVNVSWPFFSCSHRMPILAEVHVQSFNFLLFSLIVLLKQKNVITDKKHKRFKNLF